jgi:hypothetical protein
MEIYLKIVGYSVERKYGAKLLLEKMRLWMILFSLKYDTI